jgi:hypothetical protein
VSPIRNTGFRFYAPRTIDKSAFSSTVMLNSSKTCNRPQ